MTRQLLTVTGSVSGATTTYTYDSYGRIATVTDPEGYAVSMAYDALDRLTQVTYPDTTTETWTYQRLDLVAQKRSQADNPRYHSQLRRVTCSSTNPPLIGE